MTNSKNKHLARGLFWSPVVFVNDVIFAFIIKCSLSGVEINARPLARGEWKPRGMSRICAEVVRRASFFFFFFFFSIISLKEFVSFLRTTFEGYSLGDNSYEGAQSNINGDEVRV